MRPDSPEPLSPKPPPPELYPWPVRAWSVVWAYLSWPWQVRQFKAYGFRRVGWMTWETGPDEHEPPPSVPDLLAPPVAPALRADREPLSPAALDVQHELERLARAHPGASAPGLVLLLARRYCPRMLRRRWKP